MQFELGVEFVVSTCPTCHVVFALERGFFDARVADHRFFWCPNAHQMQFSQETPEEVRIRQLERDSAAQGAALVAERRENERLLATIADGLAGPVTLKENG
jgi:hypothetical protein